MNEEYPFGTTGPCVVCGKTTSHMANCDGEYIPLCHGQCTQKFKGKDD